MEAISGDPGRPRRLTEAGAHGLVKQVVAASATQRRYCYLRTADSKSSMFGCASVRSVFVEIVIVSRVLERHNQLLDHDFSLDHWAGYP